MAAVQPAAASSSSSSSSPPQPTPPSVTLTPATPASTDLATLGTPVSPQQETLAEVPTAAATGSDMAHTTNGSSKVDANGAGPSTSPPPKAPSTSTARPAPSSSSMPRSVPSTQQKKRKRRKGGFASLLLAFGCLSADEFEEPEKRPKPTSTPAAPPPTSEKLSAVKEKEKPVATSGEASSAVEGGARLEQGHQAGTTETTGTTLVGHETLEDKDGQKGVLPAPQVVVAPVEPVNVPLEETAGLTSSAVQPPGSGSELLSTPSKGRRESDSQAATDSKDRSDSSGGYSNISESDLNETDTQAVPQDEYTLDDYEDEEDRLIAQGGMGIPIDENGNPRPLLPAIEPVHAGRKCLVLDLDETLLHSSFKMLPQADYIVPVEIEGQTHNVYVIKRPGVDKFLREMGRIYEVVVFTASLSKYADPVLDMLDPSGVVKHRLFRESCYNHKGNYVKDLSQLGRDLETSIIIDNSPASYIFHPNNAVPVSTWFNDPHDTELTDLCPFLADLATVDDVRGVLDGSI